MGLAYMGHIYRITSKAQDNEKQNSGGEKGQDLV